MYHCFQHKHSCVSSVKSRQSSFSGIKLFTSIQADYLTIPDINNRLKKKKKNCISKYKAWFALSNSGSKPNRPEHGSNTPTTATSLPPRSVCCRKTKSHAMCGQLPTCVTDWLQASKAPKDTA